MRYEVYVFRFVALKSATLELIHEHSVALPVGKANKFRTAPLRLAPADAEEVLPLAQPLHQQHC